MSLVACAAGVTFPDCRTSDRGSSMGGRGRRNGGPHFCSFLDICDFVQVQPRDDLLTNLDPFWRILVVSAPLGKRPPASKMMLSL